MNITIGTCSICGGPVTVPYVWHGVTPPTKQCEQCGAVPVDTYGPVIPMRPDQGNVRIWNSSQFPPIQKEGGAK